MAPIDGLRDIVLTEAHLDAALALSTEAGWNQVADDWRLMLAHGKAFGLEAPDSKLVASGLTLPYPDGGFAWISMILVTQAWRRHGLATRLMHRCIEEITAQGLVPVLDATPAGAEVYRQLGFRPTMEIQRLQGHIKPRPLLASFSQKITSALLPEFLATDRAVFGADRSFISKDLFRRTPKLARHNDWGFMFGRSGRTALQVGPIVARNWKAALGVIPMGTETQLIDVPIDQEEFLGGLRAVGFTVQRPYIRMAYRCDTVWGDPAGTYAIAGPELG